MVREIFAYGTAYVNDRSLFAYRPMVFTSNNTQLLEGRRSDESKTELDFRNR